MCITEKRDVRYASENQGLKTPIKTCKIKIYVFRKQNIHKQRNSEHIKSLTRFGSELYIVKKKKEM